jgi:thioesterase domain-containing protein
MESLIDRIATDITARAPVGPIRLLGFSLGGHVAFGAACRLAAEGHEIGFLGILDTNTERRTLPVVRGSAPVRTLRRARWEIYNLAQAARRGALLDGLGQTSAKFLTRPGKQQRLRLAKRLLAMPLPSSYAMFLHMYLREELQARLLLEWQSGPSRHLRLDAPVVLFRSQEHSADDPKDLGWSPLCPRLHVVEVAGGHKSMLRPPHVDDLRNQLVTGLKQATNSQATRFVA